MLPAALAALSLSLAQAPAAPAPGALVARLQAARAGGPRAAAAAGRLLGLPYALDPLGEAAGRDPDPRFRLDAFDCMTLVESAVALGSSGSVREARLAIDDVRYEGPPSFAGRNHEVVSQWIPANERKGWIAEVTPAVAGPLARRVEKRFDERSWELVRRAGRSLPGVPRGRLPRGTFGLHVVAPEDVPAIAPRLPEGTIAFVVREDAADRATPVTHAGIVARGAGGAALVRHATSTKGVGRVIEEGIERFLRRQVRAHPSRRLLGLSFFEIRDNSSRIRALDRGDPRPK